jgi:hypothetical protein
VLRWLNTFAYESISARASTCFDFFGVSGKLL